MLGPCCSVLLEAAVALLVRRICRLDREPSAVLRPERAAHSDGFVGSQRRVFVVRAAATVLGRSKGNVAARSSGRLRERAVGEARLHRGVAARTGGRGRRRRSHPHTGVDGAVVFPPSHHRGSLDVGSIPEPPETGGRRRVALRHAVEHPANVEPGAAEAVRGDSVLQPRSIYQPVELVALELKPFAVPRFVDVRIVPNVPRGRRLILHLAGVNVDEGIGRAGVQQLADPTERLSVKVHPVVVDPINVRGIDSRPIRSVGIVVEPPADTHVACCRVPFAVRQALLPALHVVVHHVLVQVDGPAVAVPIVTISGLWNGVRVLVGQDLPLQSLEGKHLDRMVRELSNRVVELDPQPQSMGLGREVVQE
mmetsp:Transcript_14465/g.42801  ORF Transcript_14465/g.42801 Transcript_14465/m.42801 type:complete len:366 (-) Transcript_14465:882-1979(-)